MDKSISPETILAIWAVGTTRATLGRTKVSVGYSKQIAFKPEGPHKLRFEFEATGEPYIGNGKGAPGISQLYIDGRLVGQGDISLTPPLMWVFLGGVVCGADTGSPVWDNYQPPFKFRGTLHSAIVDVSGERIKDDEHGMKMIMTRQLEKIVTRNQ